METLNPVNDVVLLCILLCIIAIPGLVVGLIIGRIRKRRTALKLAEAVESERRRVIEHEQKNIEQERRIQQREEEVRRRQNELSMIHEALMQQKQELERQQQADVIRRQQDELYKKQQEDMRIREGKRRSEREEYRKNQREEEEERRRWVDTDHMTGIQFEQFCSVELKQNHGFVRVEFTKTSGDYGGDLIAYHQDGSKWVIQCKRYNGHVGIDAVQEVLGAKSIYDAERMAVMTNNVLTASARELADKSGVELFENIKGTMRID